MAEGKMRSRNEVLVLTERLISQLRKWATTEGYEGSNRWPLEVPREMNHPSTKIMRAYGMSPAGSCPRGKRVLRMCLTR